MMRLLLLIQKLTVLKHSKTEEAKKLSTTYAEVIDGNLLI